MSVPTCMRHLQKPFKTERQASDNGSDNGSVLPFQIRVADALFYKFFVKVPSSIPLVNVFPIFTIIPS